MPILESASSKRRSRIGDLLAVLFLLAILAGLGWLWWQPKTAPEKPPQTVRISTPVVQPPAVHQVIPSLTLVERVPPSAIEIQPSQTNPAPAVVLSNAPPSLPPATVSSRPPVPVPAAVEEWPRPAKTVLEAQIALARRAISPGSIDGALGSQTRAALAAFQQQEQLLTTRELDTNTQAHLTLEAPLFSSYEVTSNDLARLQPVGHTWLAKSQQTALDYETILELVAEKAHTNPLLIRRLNPSANWTSMAAGTVLKIPDVDYPEPDGKAAMVVIHLSEKYLEALDGENTLLAHFPCSIAAKVEKRPVGELHVSVIAPHPNYTFDPAVFVESPEAQAVGHKLVLPPGPNNPVGVAWIGLDKPGYGMHGTPNPEQVGRTESHGCFRLANWDAEYLVKLAWIGMPVRVEP